MSQGSDVPLLRRMVVPLAPVALLALAICLFYAFAFAYIAPYAGLDVDVGWSVLNYYDPCVYAPDWCATHPDTVRPGDRLIRIGELTYSEYRTNRSAVPFAGFAVGTEVPVAFVRDGQAHEAVWLMLGPVGSSRFVRMASVIFFLPFWLAGTVVLLFMRPRDARWYLLIAFNYVTAIWLTIGVMSATQVSGAVVSLRVITALLVPVALHLHLMLPSPLFRRAGRWLIPLLYVVGGMALLVQMLMPSSSQMVNSLGLLFAVGGSLVTLLYRSATEKRPPARLATRFMLTGIGLAFLPGLILWVVPSFLNVGAVSVVATYFATVPIPLMPLFYVYALYKQRLGNLEFRANRLLSLYSFLALYGTAFIMAFMAGSSRLDLTGSGLVYALIVSTSFLAIALFLQPPFQRFIDRLAYGTAHNPNDILRAFANQIPRAISRDELTHLLTTEVTSSLLIRQSALCLIGEGMVTTLYADRVDPPGTAQQATLRGLAAQAGRYRPPEPNADGPLAWARLVVPIEVRGEIIGLWLLGKRDPDDYYPRADIDLLGSLGGQIGVALETTRLVENLERRATELERAYRDLQKLDKLKDEFVQNVSHELRTPLTFVRGYTDLMLEGAFGDLNNEQREALETVADRTDGIVRLINDIISLQQAALDKVARVPVNVGTLAKSSLQAAEMLALREYGEDRAYSFALEISEDLPPVLGDRRRLSQVLDNLLSNALKFSPNGGKITLSCHRSQLVLEEGAASSEPSEVVQISVRDEGTGIPPDQLERIWERFYQVDGSSTRRFGGMGLGLAIVREIIRAHQGKIWVESSLGTGSTFHFALPVVESTGLTTEVEAELL